MILLDSPAAVQAAAGLFSGIVAAGHAPPQGMFRALVAAARVTGMLEHPSVLTASKWQDWLHPRGKDGRFIEKNSFVNIFANPNALLTDRTADRRRAKIEELHPTGAVVSYQDTNGAPLPPDDAAGFPAKIPVDDLSTKVSSAPKEIARLQPRESAAKEVKDALIPGMSQEEYDAEIARVNAVIADRHAEQIGIVSTGQGPMTEEEFSSHLSFISEINHQVAFRPEDGQKAGDLGMSDGRSLTYDAAFKDSFGLWSEEMQQVFDAIVDEVYDELTVNQTKPKNRRAIMLGGLPGAGKSTTLKTMRLTFHDSEWITVNPDNFKDKMLERGLYPKVDGLAPAETAGFIHEASSEMNHMLEQLLTVEGYNVIFDITMGGQDRDEDNDWNVQIVKRLGSLGYHIDGIFVDVDTTQSRKRTQLRHREGLNALRTGKLPRDDEDESVLTNGGRVVPDAVIAAGEFAADDPQKGSYNSHNARNFDRLKGVFARWAIWDNGGDSPVYLAGSADSATDKANMPGYYPGGTSGEGEPE